MFLDADDRLLPGALEAGLRCFEAHPECAFVSGTSRPIAEDGTLLSPRLSQTSDTAVEGESLPQAVARQLYWHALRL